MTSRGASAECRSGPTPWDDAEIMRAAAKVWHDRGLVLIDPERLGWADREWALGVGAKLYGERKG